jgi:hypothetical protein
MCKNHHYVYEGQGSPVSKGVCQICGDVTYGRNGFPDDAYSHDNSFNLKSNPRRVKDNDIERILNDDRYPHVFNRHYLDNR